MAELKQTVLITGGSGYAGQFLAHALAKAFKVHYTYGTRKLSSAPDNVEAHKVDLVTGEGLWEIFSQTPIHSVVNCAAVSQPGVCEADPETARAVNVPFHLVGCLLRQSKERGIRAALIHFSTDQVYDGSHALWKETEQCVPVNVYGRTKLEAEQYIQSQLPDGPEGFPVAILRSSIIFGPPPLDPVGRTLFLQFVASAVQGSQPTTFFTDEFRSPVYIRDLERLTGRLLTEAARVEAADTVWPRRGSARVFNTGGPERLSRADMARQVAAALGCGYESIATASAASVNRGVSSPADISMDISRLTTQLPGFTTTPFRRALEEIFPHLPPTATVEQQQ